MMRQAGMNFEVMRGNSPGHSLRCARSPVPPTSTSTCGNFGPTPGGILVNLFIPHADAPSRAADQAHAAISAPASAVARALDGFENLSMVGSRTQSASATKRPLGL